MSMGIAVTKEQLTLLAAEVAPLLRQGLPHRLQETTSVLDGMAAGVGPLRALGEISTLVSTGNRERSRPREHLLERLSENLDAFCKTRDVAARSEILLRMQCPIEILLAETREPGAPGGLEEAPLVVRLSSDVRRLLERADTFSAMAKELAAVGTRTSLLNRQARRARIAAFCERYRAYAALLDFEDSAALEDAACSSQLAQWLADEARDLEALARRVHERVYAGARVAPANVDWKADLGDVALRPALASMLKPGVDALARLSGVLEEAVEAAGGNRRLYRCFTSLGLAYESLAGWAA